MKYLIKPFKNNTENGCKYAYRYTNPRYEELDSDDILNQRYEGYMRGYFGKIETKRFKYDTVEIIRIEDEHCKGI